jgi:L-threonylcarbamoyladenylate synthase
VTLLRPGAVSRSQIADVIGTVSDPDETAPRAPGRQRSHYAPGTRLEIVEVAALRREVEEALAAGERIAVLARSDAANVSDRLVWRRMPAGPAAYGRALYATLRELDATGAGRILVESVPADESWAAVADRLERAAARGFT